MDRLQETIGGVHLMLQPMDLVTHIQGLIADATVIQLRMVMQTRTAAAAPPHGYHLHHHRNLVPLTDIR